MVYLTVSIICSLTQVVFAETQQVSASDSIQLKGNGETVYIYKKTFSCPGNYIFHNWFKKKIFELCGFKNQVWLLSSHPHIINESGLLRNSFSFILLSLYFEAQVLQIKRKRTVRGDSLATVKSGHVKVGFTEQGGHTYPPKMFVLH